MSGTIISHHTTIPVRKRFFPSGRVGMLTAAAGILALLLAVPILSVVWLATTSSPVPGFPDGIWGHLMDGVFVRYISVTLLLMGGVALGSTLIGVPTAWLVTMYDFPASRLLQWALVLPMAMPAYIAAYVYTDLLEVSGPLQSALRSGFGWSVGGYWFPEIRSLGGAITVMTVTLYPYVYLLARAAFLNQSVCAYEVGRTLGYRPWSCFLRISIPLARPAIAVGLSLVLMETLNDFGTVDYFAVPTLTVGIYDIWTNMSSIAGAAQLSCSMLALVALLLIGERWTRHGQRYHQTSTKYRSLTIQSLPFGKGILAHIYCVVPVLLGFFLPCVVLTDYAVDHFVIDLQSGLIERLANSLGLGMSAAFLTLCIGLFLAYAAHIDRNPLMRGVARLASIGYTLPGAVLAIGVIIPMATFDALVADSLNAGFNWQVGLIFSGTVFGLLYGYACRFVSLSYGAIESGLSKITPNIDAVARSLGASPLESLEKIHLPLLRGSMVSAVLLVFVDCVKELPMTMILRPFNFETLATHVHAYASDELIEHAALGALTIVLITILPVIGLCRSLRLSRPGTTSSWSL